MHAPRGLRGDRGLNLPEVVGGPPIFRRRQLRQRQLKVVLEAPAQRQIRLQVLLAQLQREARGGAAAGQVDRQQDERRVALGRGAAVLAPAQKAEAQEQHAHALLLLQQAGIAVQTQQPLVQLLPAKGGRQPRITLPCCGRAGLAGGLFRVLFRVCFGVRFGCRLERHLASVAIQHLEQVVGVAAHDLDLLGARLAHRTVDQPVAVSYVEELLPQRRQRLLRHRRGRHLTGLRHKSADRHA